MQDIVGVNKCDVDDDDGDGDNDGYDNHEDDDDNNGIYSPSHFKVVQTHCPQAQTLEWHNS